MSSNLFNGNHYLANFLTQPSRYLMLCLSLPVTWMRRRSSALEFELRGQLNQWLDKKKEKKSRCLRYLAPIGRAFSFNVLMKINASGVTSNLSAVLCYLVEKKEIPWGCNFHMVIPCLKLHKGPLKSSKSYMIKERKVAHSSKIKRLYFFYVASKLRYYQILILSI